MVRRLQQLICLLAAVSGTTLAAELPAPQPPAPSVLPAPAAPQPPQKGYVLQVAGKLVYLDLGQRDNVRVGDTFEIIRDQEIVHPVTGEGLGSKAPVGLVRVTQVFEKLSVAEVVSVIPGASMMRMDRVRMGNESLEPPSAAPPKPDSTQAIQAPLPTVPTAGHELVHTPDGVVGGIDLGLGGGYETTEKANEAGAHVLLPLSRRFVAGGGYSRSRASHEGPASKQTDTEEEIEGRLRVYLHRMLRRSEDLNPDGEVGSLVMDLAGGLRTAKTTVESPIILSIDTTRVPRDTTRGVSTTTAKGTRTGIGVGFIFPLAQRWTAGLTYDWAKDVSRIGSWFRFYSSAIDPDWEGANPDGKIGSFVATAFGSYDTKNTGPKKWMGADLKFPLSRMLTFGLTYDTNRKLHRIRGGLNFHIERRILR